METSHASSLGQGWAYAAPPTVCFLFSARLDHSDRGYM